MRYNPPLMQPRLRAAAPADLPQVVGLIQELADFEKLGDQVRVTADSLHPHLFGERPRAECVVVEQQGVLIGFALFFVNFSTWLGMPGLYLEDLYVKPEHRGTGLGTRLLRHLAELAVARDYGRFEWSVLDWNTDAIGFYQRMGATVMPDWRICRITGEALTRLAQGDPPPPPAPS
jgi:GNAT superfamily N-acetyltransferase